MRQTGENRQANDDFEMVVENVFFIKDHGVVLTGRIKRGVIRRNDVVTVKNAQFVVTLIDVIPNQVEFAEAGMNAGLHLNTFDASFFNAGDVVFAKRTPSETANDEYLDDITFIRDMKHFTSGPWHQYDVLLAARGYGWDIMKDWADYMSQADLEHISQVTTGALGVQETDITQSYLNNGGKCKNTPELNCESGTLSIAGMSRAIKAPMKIVWINQTQVLRFFTLSNDELLVRKYIETMIRRTFSTENAMKLGKPIPEGQ